MKYKNSIPISQWSEDDQPREKMLSKGKSSLSDAELIAILLRTGDSHRSALEQAKSILNKASNDINTLAKTSARDFMKMEGIGLAKATSLVAAMELGRRRKEKSVNLRQKIRSSKDAHECIKDVFYDLEYEEFWLLILNRSNDVLSRKKISQGGVSGTVADNKLIFKHVLDELGSSLIVFHNHPSGNMQPSKADEALTKKIKEAAINLDVALLDHIIVYNEQYFSFADEGML